MKRIGNLYPKIVSFPNLYTAFRKAFRGSGHTRRVVALANPAGDGNN